MKLTKEEEELVRARRKRNEVKVPKYSGTLKQDLYVFRTGTDYAQRTLTMHVNVDDIVAEHGDYIPSSVLPSILKKFKAKINELTKIPKGTRFVGYVSESGETSWRNLREDEDDMFADDNYSDLSPEWAEKNLENITTSYKRNLKATSQVLEKISR